MSRWILNEPMGIKFVQVGNRIFNLQALDWCSYESSANQCRLTLYIAGEAFTLWDKEADHIWRLLKSQAMNVTPQPAKESI